ncbi:hypothetical protein SAMD00019534_103710 [Acytostelium subglobosum LB1]|uniref:hypothetical protein n=1 Tax=Acytostelium subglobosum LB1 TaxID=1410327 RepID=UPI000644A953|nr:hypothetical protein SAMD00019534_103710 [Acytostelium subglobosum LB1]GAM27196.1 hypothetical protein SAMD00019534_103710 [Acytostelium subglobosum LB1]|eukprot:XP_012749663.1 hypothetical protein SAMD00019534_103710 [Acytostelium subglobosum LB1]
MSSSFAWLKQLLGIDSQDMNDAGTRMVYANDPVRNDRYPKNAISNTKYTVISFIPKNLLEQFGRAMNIYFLMIGVLQLFPSITPVDPISTWGALIFIFAVSAVKEAYDDLNRRRRDYTANKRLYQVVRDGVKRQVCSEDISVGDIIWLPCDAEIPVDMVLLATSDPDGSCYVQTANLDGETDLKARSAPSDTAGFSLADLGRFKGTIECPRPNAEIYRFDARLSMNGTGTDWIILDNANFVLQATHLRNTDYIYGIAVYTGNETKVGKNKKVPASKWTKLDRSINNITIFIFCLQLTLVFIFGAIGDSIRRSQDSDTWYLGYSSDYKAPWYEFVIIPLRFLLLNSMMIPISLKVTIDVVKYFYALFIDWDLRMYHRPTESYAVANSTALSEDLGQIEHVFTDKTGTLTENRMLFAKCSIGNHIFGQGAGTALDDPELTQLVQHQQSDVIDFFMALSLCHSVIPTIDADGNIHYKAASPDEEALIIAASKLNIKFISKTMSTLAVQVIDRLCDFQLLHTFEFNSDRKRMSVVVRDLSSKLIRIITKGADDVIFARLVNDNQSSYEAPLAHIEEFASLGLRTLCVAEKDLTEGEYQQWFKQYYQPASISMENRQQQQFEAYNVLENGLRLLGITAIEDKLQEEVPETISSLRQANIKVWMLTGDKYSTAIQIAHSCNLIDRGCKIYTVGKPLQLDDPHESHNPSTGANARVTPDEVMASIRSIHDDLVSNQQQPYQQHDHHQRQQEDEHPQGQLKQRRRKDATIVIEGHVVDIALRHASQELLDLSCMVPSVICCRVTPHQKAEVVRLVKNTGKICLAVGDGGNDVSMIQEANIGVGISGREGLQASRAADYSVARFKYLRDLIFVHGRYSYLRTSFVANYSFYKSLFICFIQILYQLFSGFGGSSFFNTFSLTSYNIIFTGLPIMGYILDKDLPESILKRNPYLYSVCQEGRAFSVMTFIEWALRAAFQSILIFCMTAGPFAFLHGSTIDYDSFSMISFTAVIFLQSLTLFLASHTITKINHLLIWGTIPVYILCAFALNSIPTMTTYAVLTNLVKSADFWGSFFLILVTCIMPVVTISYMMQLYMPTIVEMINIIRKENNPDLKRPVMSSVNGSQHPSRLYKFLLKKNMRNGRLARSLIGEGPDNADQEYIELVVVEDDDESHHHNHHIVASSSSNSIVDLNGIDEEEIAEGPSSSSSSSTSIVQSNSASASSSSTSRSKGGVDETSPLLK